MNYFVKSVIMFDCLYKYGRETRDYEHRFIFIGPAGQGDMLLLVV